jgi:tetratricopeptide (TPR) repeat protein
VTGKKFSIEAMTFAAVVISAALAFLFRPGGPGHSALPDPIVDSVNKRVEQLLGSRAQVETVGQKAMQAKALIKSGDFAGAQKIIDDVYARSKVENWHFHPFNIFSINLIDYADPAFGRRLDEWVAKSGQSALPLYLRADYLNALAWQKRGTNTANKTADDQMAQFEGYREKALSDVNAAFALDGKNPFITFEKLDIVHGDGNSARMEAVFQEAIGRFPGYYGLYSVRLGTLATKWGGSVDEMYDFVDKYAGAAPKESPMKMLYLELYLMLIGEAEFDCREMEGEAWKGCAVADLQKLDRPSLDKGLNEAIGLYDHTDKFQYNEFLLEKFGPVMTTASYDNHALDIVQAAAEKTGSDLQMMETNPGHNDFAFDILTAWSWARAGNNEDAQKKFEEAIQDMAHAQFPNDEERLLQMAVIYSNLGGVMEQKTQYAEAIAYRIAADALSGVPGNARDACHDYYRLKDYPATIDFCGKIADRSNDPEARVWRGMAYEKLGNYALGEKDLMAVAASDAPLRNFAASNVDWMLAMQEDWKGMMAFFDAHPYRFDEKTQTKNNLSLAFNNRCDAYMNLGELQKALDDCNTSLRYGNIPDAVSKQRQLMKRLQGHEKGI